ncbi:prepilin-type N-terminal cleavage/methylation domain-containing protein [Campylobacter sp. 50012-21]|uniref:prepilin-type N-terminal cleavage/methylation domain-containing protein n=1 Tax=Campylobacter magnus TaxID=3026462 RepID=UPI00236123F7|nr:prepilin-type N-terminal cleavage/methylation domain-containing protein [Campylobacter magnus]MDD0846001.1 prepilin-type N-terminal cleavage/methylation domain-containing protein [Campylobacter magnus]
MKGAFSLIELLLAIVVVGVAVAALPFIAISTGKANVQAVVSEVVTSSRIFIDDILSEPWNSAIADGFTDSSGAVMYSGILDTQSGDPRVAADTKKYFSRTLARAKEAKDDKEIKKAVGVGSCNSGINCKNGAEAELSKGSKNAFDFHITAEVKFLNINDEKIVGKKITVTFDDTKTATGTSNAMLVSATATGKNGGDIIEGVKQIKLNGFAFNIGTEPR